jgi:hypothetical protein
MASSSSAIPPFLPLMEKLNRRKAVVYTHPTTAKCCGNLIPGILDVTVEYNTDTTRTIASLLFGGTLKRCPDLRFIFSHAGGTAPDLMWRFEAQARCPATSANVLPAGVIPTLRRHYYDCAQSAQPITIRRWGSWCRIRRSCSDRIIPPPRRSSTWRGRRQAASPPPRSAPSSARTRCGS